MQTFQWNFKAIFQKRQDASKLRVQEEELCKINLVYQEKALIKKFFFKEKENKVWAGLKV